ncbi:MAG: alpha-glucan family phosphorylase [Deltaproteobacteria bacterium]|nr:MAG: alpha-glucan family phosphorylase [Deltaproteobacteria bacterium]
MLDLRSRLAELARNLWWSWTPDTRSLLRAIDLDLWLRVDRNPVAFVRAVSDERLAAAERDPRTMAQVTRLEKSLRDYLESDKHWGHFHAPGLRAWPVAYFSPEFCLDEALPIYSGGLGVLAGDHLKSCSDLGIPTIGVSLLYRQGYFRQSVDEGGRQVETYVDIDTEQIPAERATDASGDPVTIEVFVGPGRATLDVWKVVVGRCSLILLDLRECTLRAFQNPLRLYGGGSDNRIFQEVLLGIGGYRALRALGIRPGVIHLNEGHSAFAALEATAELMETTGVPFHEAAATIAEFVVFTTHTPVEAGHDYFHPDQVLHFLAPLHKRLGIDDRELLALGRTRPEDDSDLFCMTVLAIKMSRRTNAVSSLHGAVSRNMWRSLWPDRRPAAVPIGHITNGVHVGTWLAGELAQLYEDCLGPDWRDRMCEPELWRGIERLEPSDLWRIKNALKARLIDYVAAQYHERYERLGLGEPPPPPRPDVLTIGVARRFAAYKRPLLLFEDLERAKRLLTNPERPIQVIFAGKAHPADQPSKAMLERLIEISQSPELRGHVFFLENYNKGVARLLLEGCDVWLNMPRRPLEACGTSGMKAVFNATLNCSVLDGWWDEAWDMHNGFAIGDGRTYADPAVKDRLDAQSLYEVLEREVAPLYYERDEDGFSEGWIERVKTAIMTLAWRYNSDRMVKDYVRMMYLPASMTETSDARD